MKDENEGAAMLVFPKMKGEWIRFLKGWDGVWVVGSFSQWMEWADGLGMDEVQRDLSRLQLEFKWLYSVRPSFRYEGNLVVQNPKSDEPIDPPFKERLKDNAP